MMSCLLSPVELKRLLAKNMHQNCEAIATGYVIAYSGRQRRVQEGSIFWQDICPFVGLVVQSCMLATDSVWKASR